ncbi:MAG: S8 family serine peptidase [Chlorobiota bacterium]
MGIGAYAVLLVATYVATAEAQEAWRVFFRDKGPEPFRQGSPLYEQTIQLISPRALQRRAKVRPPDSLVTLEDAPIYQPYVDSVQRWGRVWLRLRWKNYVVVWTDSAGIERIRRLPFVRAVQPTREVPLVLPFPVPGGSERSQAPLANQQLGDCGVFQYGPSWNQLQMLAVPELHRMGITGDSVWIGLLDTGFRWRGHRAFSHLRVRAEYDFLFGDTLTTTKPGEHPRQDLHGTLVLSVVGALWRDTLIGVAPTATYVLAKTEDIAAERHIEEDAYAAALEWMEALGVDVASSSLGYRDFDSTEVSYTPEQLDGRTTIVAQALEAAARRGVICVTAMGNDGGRGLVSPADADSALAIAAVDSLGNRVWFSSVGRWRNGVLRPSLAAQGLSVVAAAPGETTAVRASGTSMATPLVAGSVALLIAARPDLPPWRIRQALLQTASNATQPDTLLGYGIPNVWRTLQALGGAIGPPAVWRRASEDVRVASYALVPFSLFSASLQLASRPGGESVGSIPLSAWGRERVLFYGDLPAALVEGRETLWVRVTIRSAAGDELVGRWYAVTRLPTVPCGMWLPDAVRVQEAVAGPPALRIFPTPAARGAECYADLPELSPRTGSPLQRIQLWDGLGRRVWEYQLPADRLWGSTGQRWTVRLPTEQLVPGTYWLEALYGVGTAERLMAPLVVY